MSSSGLEDLRRRLGINPVGGALLALGTVLVLAAFVVLNWFRSGPGFFGGAGDHTSFREVHDSLEGFKAHIAADGLTGYVTFGASDAYFSWLGWLLLIGAAGLGFLAVSRFGRDYWLARWLGAVAGAAGIGFTFFALDLFVFQSNAQSRPNTPSYDTLLQQSGTPTYGDFLSHAGVGAWAAIAGFLAILVASLLPHRET